MLSRFTPPEGLPLGPIVVYFYSLCFAAAVWLAYWLANRQRERFGLSQERLTDLILLVLVAGVIGSRIGYGVQNLSYFSSRPGEIWQLTTGGLSIHGGIIAGLLATYWYAKRHQLNFLKLTDLLALPLLAGQIVGRLGNYFNQELFGYPTQRSWRLLIDPDQRPPGYEQFSYFHPTFLYEMLINSVGLLIFWRWRPQKTGLVTAGYLLVFATSRFITEIWRISDRVLGPLSLAQLISLAIGLAALVWLASTGNIFKKVQQSLAGLRQNRNTGRHKQH